MTRIALGRTTTTAGAMAAILEAGENPARLLQRHAVGDWGDLSADDVIANKEATEHEGDPNRQLRVVSAYKLASGVTVWVITEWDRSSTILLLPDEY